MIRHYLANSTDKYAPKWLVLSFDVILIALSFIVSYVIRFNLTFNFDIDKLLVQIPIIVLISVLSLLVTGAHKSVVRHTGVRDVYNIFNNVCILSIITIFLVIINKEAKIIEGFTIPLSIIIIHSLISFIALTAARYLFKTLYYSLIGGFKATKNVMIYGAGESGILTYNAITEHSKNPSKVIGYIDDDVKKMGKSINGVKVFRKSDITKDFINKRVLSEVIFSMHNIDGNKLRKIVESFVDLDIQVKIVPPVENWINGELKVSQIKSIQIEDLLNRMPINIKSSSISRQLADQTIVVTGGAGSIGSEIVRQIVKYTYKHLVIIDQAESALYDLQQELKQNGFYNYIVIVGDIRDKNRMNSIFTKYKPTMLFHAAAYKHVPLMEYNAYEAIKINVAGTKCLVDLAVTHKVKKFVFVSTDKAVNPTNVMGATKRIAEMYLSCVQQKSDTKFITTRFGNVLGSNGSVIPLFKKQIEKGGP